MKLQCISAYSNKPLKVTYHAGDVFEVDEKVGQHLLHDSPDSFINVSALEAAEQAIAKLQSELEQKPDDQGQTPPDPSANPTQGPGEQASEPKGKKKATE